MGGAIREAILAALVAGALALPIVGVRTADRATGLDLEGRLSWVLYAMAAVFAGRLLVTGLRRLMPGGARIERLGGKARAVIEAHATGLGLMALAAAAILPFTPWSDRLFLDRAVYVLIYVMLGWGLNVVVGLAGLLDLGYVAFYAVGAYTYALLSTHLGLSFWLCLPLAGIFAAGFGILLGFPVLRLRGDYLAIVTLGFGEIIRVILINWTDLTGGPNGVSGIPKPSLFGLMVFSNSPAAGETAFHEFFEMDYSPEHRLIFFYFLILGLALLTNLFALRLRRLPIGRAWEALREDETACRSLGINPTNTKLSAFAIGALFAGIAGSFFATRQGFISPESFTFMESAIILAIVVLGGMGSQIGVVIAAVVLVLGPELIRELQEYRMLAFGALMVLIMLWKPGGLLSHRAPSLRLRPRQAEEGR